MLEFEGVAEAQEVACQDLEAQRVEQFVGRVQERVVAEVVVQHLLAGSSINRRQSSALRPYIPL
jgi:hypothetical protein